MRTKFFRLSAYIKYLYKRRTIRYIHSPHLFSLMWEVFPDPKSFLQWPIIFGGIELFRKRLKENTDIISYEDLGAGGDIQRIKKVRIGDLVKKSVKEAKYARFLYRLIKFTNPETVVELGTSLGITTIYLSTAVGLKGKLYTVEGDKNILNFAKQHWKQTIDPLRPPASYCFDLNEKWTLLANHIQKIDFLFIDANHRKEAMIRYVLQALPYLHKKSVVVLDDIHWNRETLEAWNILKARKEVTLSFDIFQMGVLLFDKSLSKEDYTLKY